MEESSDEKICSLLSLSTEVRLGVVDIITRIGKFSGPLAFVGSAGSSQGVTCEIGVETELPCRRYATSRVAWPKMDSSFE